MYTVMGDTVNVAARLETPTKDYPKYSILINGPTAKALKGRDDVVLKSLSPLQVKGRAEPADVYPVVGWRKSQQESLSRELGDGDVTHQPVGELT